MAEDTPFEVLVVEDEALIRMTACDAISSAGMVAREAGDAAEALQILTDHPEVGLLFTDVNLPGGMCGITLSHHVHGECAEMEFILTSGAQTVSSPDLRNHGTFLPKPYSDTALMTIVWRKCGYWQRRSRPS